MVVVSHPLFMGDVQRLVAHRRSQGLRVELVTTEQVYNEFSSGMKDITAIKDMMRMLFQRANGDSTLMPEVSVVGWRW